jgi:hypothetical protein
LKSAPWNHGAFLAPLAIMASVLWACRRAIFARILPWPEAAHQLGGTAVLIVLAVTGTAAALAGTILARRSRR